MTQHQNTAPAPEPQVIVRDLGRLEYEPTWRAMQTFTDQRNDATTDEIWLLEHPPVFTQGQAGKAEHLLAPGSIPVIQVDRGGQVTYHGPGQLVAYLLVDIRRLNIGARDLVSRIENALVDTLATLDIPAAPRSDAPGVYTGGRKIASLGLRIRKGCSFHGLALNIDMDLSPFQLINPCGYAGMEMAQIRDFVASPDSGKIRQQLLTELIAKLGYNRHSVTHQPWNS